MDKIYLDHVNYIYSPGTPFEHAALKDINLGIRAGCITGIIGHTGSGKSTMMQMLNGLTAPTSGKIYLDGYDINATTADVTEEWLKLPEYANLSKSAAKKAIRDEVRRRRRSLCFRVGLVMQYPEYQLFEETVYRDIAFGPTNMGLSEEDVRERVREASAFTDLSEDLWEKSPFDLSGGQKRRVALAGVIAMRPEVLVLDEPAAGLDPRGRDYIFDGISAFQKKTGCTVLIVSHSMEDMARYCDDVVVMENARVLMSGDCKEVFSQIGKLSDVGLDIPQITHLMRLLRERSIPVSEDIYTVDRAIDAILTLLDAKRGGQGE